jgi:hypothetical protein
MMLAYTCARFEGTLEIQKTGNARFWAESVPSDLWFELTVDGRRILYAGTPNDDGKGNSEINLPIGIHRVELTAIFGNQPVLPVIRYRADGVSEDRVLGAEKVVLAPSDRKRSAQLPGRSR